MLFALAALAFAQDEVPLIATLPPPPLPPRCEPREQWPQDDWTSLLIDSPAADVLSSYLFPAHLDRSARDRAGIRTDGVVVLHGGVVIYERYSPDWTAQQRHLSWSASKTFASTLTGIAVHQGLLSLDDSICEHYATDNPATCAITVQHLLEMSSGLDWRETYEGVSPTASSVLAMLYGEGQPDMARFVGGHPLIHEPGAHWRYSSGDTNLLMAVVGAAMSPVHGERYPWVSLFEPLNLQATFERDSAGTYVGSSYVWATPRHLARLGYLWLNNGCWDNTPLLDDDWVERATAPNSAMKGVDQPYGWLVWLNQPLNDGEPLPWPGAPADAYAARGHWGQSIIVLPSDDLVIVRTADDRDDSFEPGRMVQLARALVETP